VEYLLPQLAERRPAADTLRELRLSCESVLANAEFGNTFGDRMAELVPSGHPLRSNVVPVRDLAVAVLDPVRDPGRYGGGLDHVESRWRQLGAWVAEVGLPDDACHHLVRAVARAARDVSGEDWDSASSSGWAALQMWMRAHLDAGVQQVRGPVVPRLPSPAGPERSAGSQWPARQPTPEPLQQALHRPAAGAFAPGAPAARVVLVARAAGLGRRR
jgi:hypothetical protein